MKKLNNKYIIAMSVVIIISLFAINVRAHKVLMGHLKIAEQYTLSGDYDKALSEYSYISKKDSKNPIWYCKISEIYSANNNLNKSREYINKAKTMKYTKQKEVLNYIVFNEFMNGDYDNALKDGEEAMRLYPKNKEIISTMFTVYMAGGKEEKGKNLLNNYKIDKTSSEDLVRFSKMNSNLGQNTQAFNMLKDAYKVNKDDIRVYDTISEMCSNDFNGTLEKINNMRKDNSDNIMCNMWLAKAYSLNKEVAGKAIDILEDMNTDKNNVQAELIKVSAYSNLGNFGKGDKEVKVLEKKYPKDYRVLHSLGWYYFKKGDLDKAKDYCRRSIEQNTNYWDNYGYLMPEIIKGNNKKNLQALYFRKALFLQPYDYNIMLNAGEHYLHVVKDTETALKYYKLADSVKPKDDSIKYDIALIHLSRKENKKAIDNLNKCIKLKPSEIKYYRTLSTAYMSTESYKESFDVLQKAYVKDKTDILTINNIAVYNTLVEGNVERSYKTISNVFQTLKKNKDYDSYTREVINGNYKKIKDMVVKYREASVPSIKVPELTLFY